MDGQIWALKADSLTSPLIVTVTVTVTEDIWYRYMPSNFAHHNCHLLMTICSIGGLSYVMQGVHCCAVKKRLHARECTEVRRYAPMCGNAVQCIMHIIATMKLVMQLSKLPSIKGNKFVHLKM